MTAFLSDWGWLLGIAWLTYLGFGLPLPWRQRAAGTTARAAVQGAEERRNIAEADARQQSDRADAATAAAFYPELILSRLEILDLTGLKALRPQNQRVTFHYRMSNHSGLPVVFSRLEGKIVIGTGEESAAPELHAWAGAVGLGGECTITIDQPVPSFTDTLFSDRDGNLMGKYNVLPMSLAGLVLVCEATYPNGRTEERQIGLTENTLLLRGPILTDADFVSIARSSTIGLGVDTYYDGTMSPTKTWQDIDG